MTGQQFVQGLQDNKFSFSVAVNYGNRREYITQELANMNSIQQWKDHIERLRPDRAVVTVFVEDESADAQAKQALDFLSDKLEFKGDIVESREPTKNGKNFYWTANEPRQPLVGDDFDWGTDDE